MTRSISYFKVLANMLDHGNVEILIGEQYVNKDEWGRAALYFEKGIKKGVKKGKLSNLSRAHMLLGDTYYKLGNISRAEENFRKARDDKQ